MTELAELLDAVASLETLAIALLVFGVAPGFVLRLLVKIYPRDDPRRRELIAELYVLDRVRRLFFVAEQLETVLFEGVPTRCRQVIRRVRLSRKRARERPDVMPFWYRVLVTIVSGTTSSAASVFAIVKFDHFPLWATLFMYGMACVGLVTSTLALRALWRRSRRKRS